MKSFVFLFLYLTVFQMIFVESGIVLDSLDSGITHTRKSLRCGIHRIGGIFSRRQNTACDEKRQEVSTNEINTGEETVDKNVGAVDSNKAVTEESKAVTEGSALKSSTAKTDVVTVPGGRRMIAVGANCPPGYRGDGKGNCREEY